MKASTSWSAIAFLLAMASVSSLSVASAQAAEPAVKTFHVYIGTYTNQGGAGIYRFDFDPKTGKASEPIVAAKVDNPSFLTLNPAETMLYAVKEVSEPGPDARPTGWVVAYNVDKQSGELKELNSQPSGGPIACYVAVDSGSRNVLLANYTGGNVSCIPLQADGSLSKPSIVINHGDDEAAHKRARAHSINLSPDGRFAIAADAGLDEIFVYHYDPKTGLLKANSPPSVGTGPKTAPRHFTFHPNGKWAYNNNERNFKINSFDYNAEKGTLTLRQTLSTLPEGVEPKGSTAEVQVHPSGKFAYVSNRGPDSIATYQIDAEGTLKFVGATSTEGKTPRNFRIDPTGNFLLAANQDSNTIVVFRIDQKTGVLTATGEVIEVPNPVCIKFARAM